jgi:osmotically-inducible protein OsmY
MKRKITNESEFTRDLRIPLEENEVLSERHYSVGEELMHNYASLGPKGSRQSDDSIYEEVCDILWRSPQVDPSEIEVIVDGGIVTLKGTVYNWDFKRWAEKLIDHVPGINDVRNEIRVQDTTGLVNNSTGMI